MILTIVKIFYKFILKLRDVIDNTATRIIFRLMHVKVTSSETKGIPIIRMSVTGAFYIGEGFRMNNGFRANLVGRQQRCMFIIEPNARIAIGKNVSISSTAISCREKIIIGDNVLIGGNCVIYDTDFHPLHYRDRIKSLKKYSHLTQNKAVIISDNVFIGAHATILKGVSIGAGAVVGAGSVVTKNIPPDEVWGGNPASLFAI